MRILVTGGAGMLGQKLVERLASDGVLGGRTITAVQLTDVIAPTAPAAPFPIDLTTADLSSPGAAETLVAARPDVIFHLAAVLSGESEVDFEKGYRVNVDGTRNLLDAIRGLADHTPRVVYASSIAVFGSPLPEVIDDDHLSSPQTSYGTQKAIGELLLADYTRRGLLDGVGLRLPTLSVRPGAPNKAASGFFSSIIREPLAGREAVLPVSEETRHWHASPRSAVGFLVHAASLPSEAFGARRALTMPGVSVTVGEQLEALRRVAGDEAVALVRHEPDEAIARIVATWPRRFETRRAHELGFAAEQTFDEIIRAYLEDELM